MEKPHYTLCQNDLLKGMTSSLKGGACWGLSVRWLQECASGGPAVAGLAMTTDTTTAPLEALISHATNGNQFLSGMGVDVSISNCTVMMSSGSLDAQPVEISNKGGNKGTAMSIITAMSGGGTVHGLIVIAFTQGRHAMAVTNSRNVWALFDPNYGTWVYKGDDKGAPTSFSELLNQNFERYAVSEVKFYTISRA